MGACTSLPRSTDSALQMARLRQQSSDEAVGSSDSDGSLCYAQFIHDHQGRVEQAYDLSPGKLGVGAYGSVCRAVHKATGVQRAVKMVYKGHVRDVVDFRREVSIMKMMDHPNIIRLFETFEDKRQVYLVMELCDGGELFERIVAQRHLCEVDAAAVMTDVLRAVSYMHGKDLVHRDLKPENFLLLTKGPIRENVLKLIDFGTARKCTYRQILHTRVGTSLYVAPQVLQRRYGRECDLWSAGAMLYTALSGSPPFPGKTDQEVMAKVRLGRYTLIGPSWACISEDARELVRRLMNINPRARWTAEQALKHSWIRRFADRGLPPRLDEHEVLQLEQYESESRLKKAALQIIAGHLPEDHELRRLREQFVLLDTNGDGLLEANEVADGLEQAGLSRTASQVQRLMAGVDSNLSGAIDWTEFLAAALDREHRSDRELCWAAFNVFDLDGDGRIDYRELVQVLEGGRGNPAAERMLQDVDLNGDGYIDFAEFMEMMAGGAVSRVS